MVDKSEFSLKKAWPLLVLAVAMAGGFALGLDDYVRFAWFREAHGDIAAFVAGHGLLARLAFIAVYAGVVALSVPGGAVLTIIAGFLFGASRGFVWGTLEATVLVVVAATLGAVVVFLAVKIGIGDPLRARAGPAMRRMEEGFRRNAWSYMLILRLVPLFPFWMVNLAPAFLGVPLRIYAPATFIGIIPGSAVYASIGVGLGATLEKGGRPDLGIIFEPHILVPLLGLALLAAVPMIYRRWRGTKRGKDGARAGRR